MWWLVGYSLCFSGGSDGIYGNFHNAFLSHVSTNSIIKPLGIPTTVLIVYQMMFAIITPALITGAFTNRVTFKAYLIFLVVWQLFVYYPFVHMFWGNGLLAQWGARDFAGGIVVHASAGWAALASVLYVGKRKFVDAPHNIPFIALGTRSALVRLVRVQRRQRTEGRQRHCARLSQHRPGGVLRRCHVALHRVVARQEAALRRAADRSRRRARDDHTRSRATCRSTPPC